MKAAIVVALLASCGTASDPPPPPAPPPVAKPPPPPRPSGPSDGYVVIDAHGAGRVGKTLAAVVPFGRETAYWWLYLDPHDGTKPQPGSTPAADVDIYATLARETDILVIADPATPARIVQRLGMRDLGSHKIALAVGDASTIGAYRFGVPPRGHSDLVVRAGDPPTHAHGEQARVEITDATTTAQLVATLADLAAAGVPDLVIHRQPGWGALPPAPLDDRVDTFSRSPSSVVFAVPHVDGGLQIDGVKATLELYLPRFHYCYDRRAQPDLLKLHGVVQLAFAVAADGTISNARAQGVDPKIASCIAASVFDLEIPAPSIEKAGKVSVALTLTREIDPRDAPTPVSGFWCFEDVAGFCGREEGACDQALAAFQRGFAALNQQTTAECKQADTAWTGNGTQFAPSKASCSARMTNCHLVR